MYTTSIDGLSFSVVSGDGFVANRVVGKAASGRFVYMNRVCSRCVDLMDGDMIDEEEDDAASSAAAEDSIYVSVNAMR